MLICRANIFQSNKKHEKIHRISADSDRTNKNSLLAHIANLPGFDTSKARFVKQYSSRNSPEKSALEIVPTAAELMLPWRRDRSYQNSGTFNLSLYFFLLLFFLCKKNSRTFTFFII